MGDLTQHAVARMQQRGIRFEIVDLLFQYGSREYDHRGATILYFNKKARRRVSEQFGEAQLKQIEGKLNTYAVVGANGSIVTVGHRTKRINRG